MILEYILYTGGLFLLLAVGFVIVMKLQKKTLKTNTKLDDYAFKLFILLPAALLDWKVNWLISPFFWELPHDAKELVTDRVTRYKCYTPYAIESSWLKRYRHWFGVKLCKFLEKHDAGHCDS